MLEMQETEGKNKLKQGLTRRHFFKLAGAAAAGGALGMGLPGASTAQPSAGWSGVKNDGFWNSVRNQFIIDPRVVYMNIGTTGAMPKEILKNYSAYNRLAAYHPRTFESELGAGFGLPDQRAQLAGQFGCSPDEICLSRNTTDGLDAIVYGLSFQPGDEILVTHHEHIAALSPLSVIRDRYGVVIREVDIPVLEAWDPQQFVDAFWASVSNRTKAICFSHITYKTGTRLPAKALCEMARDNGLISIVDGAHAPGMIELDFHDMGCDFYAAPGHKWQCGPGCTGILYLRNHGDNLPEFWTQNSSTYTFLAQGRNRGDYDIAYSLQYRGQLNIPAQLAMVDVCNLWETIGRDRIEAYVCGLSEGLKQALMHKFGDDVALFSPDIPALTSGLTSINPFDDITDGDKIKTLVSRLEEDAGYQVRYTNFRLGKDDAHDTYAVRISTHLFHSPEEVDGLVDAMGDLVREIEG
jgi:selenocysteine lyase/cysteine desulfurase